MYPVQQPAGVMRPVAAAFPRQWNYRAHCLIVWTCLTLILVTLPVRRCLSEWQPAFLRSSKAADRWTRRAQSLEKRREGCVFIASFSTPRSLFPIMVFACDLCRCLRGGGKREWNKAVTGAMFPLMPPRVSFSRRWEMTSKLLFPPERTG